MDGHTEILERRRFLSLSLAGVAGAAALPGWLASAFGGQGQGGDAAPDAATRLGRAFDEARRRGRPLLVLLVPEDGIQRAHAGMAWGQLLTHGSDELLADLALCDIVCADAAGLRAALRGRATLPDDPGQAVLVETDGRDASAIAAADAWEGFSGELRFDALEEYDATYTAWVRARIGRLESELHKVLLPDWPAYERRMEACARALGIDPARLTREGLESTGMDFERAAVEAPAILRWDSCRRRWRRRQEGTEALSHAASKRLRIDAPEGSRWMQDHGCATEPEVEEPCPPGEDCVRSMVACGMGHVPAIGARFLELFTS